MFFESLTYPLTSHVCSPLIVWPKSNHIVVFALDLKSAYVGEHVIFLLLKLDILTLQFNIVRFLLMPFPPKPPIEFHTCKVKTKGSDRILFTLSNCILNILNNRIDYVDCWMLFWCLCRKPNLHNPLLILIGGILLCSLLLSKQKAAFTLVNWHKLD
jgi:hypothetical protein